jgi:GH24 family phage-related lysozyme (muramidase)
MPILQNHKRKTAAAAIAAAIAIPAEGLYHYAYYDPPGILSVCYGSTTDVQKGRYYSLDECKARLQADMMASVEAVERCAPGAPVSVLAAFSDAVYNIGPTIACSTQNSTAARMLKAGDYRGACQQLVRWDKAKVGGVLVALPGLTKRRAAERELCLKDLV